MAKKPTKAAAPAGEIDPAAQYQVKLAKSIKIGPTWVRPGSARVRMSGETLAEHLDAVAEYQVVE